MWRYVTEPTTEPVTLDELRQHFRMDVHDENDLAWRHMIAARQLVEQIVRRQLMTATLEVNLNFFPCRYINLPMAAPLQSITYIKYTDASGVLQTVDPALYQIDQTVEPARICPAVGKSWPSDVYVEVSNGVQVRYVAGNAAASGVKEMIKLAIKTMALTFFEGRTESAIPSQVLRMLSPFIVPDRMVSESTELVYAPSTT